MKLYPYQKKILEDVFKNPNSGVVIYFPACADKSCYRQMLGRVKAQRRMLTQQEKAK